MNAVERGRQSEKLCEDYLKDMGYATWRTRRTRYKNLDMFGRFDVVGCRPGRMRMVQVKTTRCSKADKERVLAFRTLNGVTREVWVWDKKNKIFAVTIRELVDGKEIEWTQTVYTS